MDDETVAAVKDALVREVIALGVLLGVLWVMGPGRVLVPAWMARARAMWGRADAHEGQVRQFASEVSRWDHEQSAQADRRPAAGGPCGCGGLPPVGHRRHPP